MLLTTDTGIQYAKTETGRRLFSYGKQNAMPVVISLQSVSFPSSHFWGSLTSWEGKAGRKLQPPVLWYYATSLLKGKMPFPLGCITQGLKEKALVGIPSIYWKYILCSLHHDEEIKDIIYVIKFTLLI